MMNRTATLVLFAESSDRPFFAGTDISPPLKIHTHTRAVQRCGKRQLAHHDPLHPYQVRLSEALLLRLARRKVCIGRAFSSAAGAITCVR